MGTEGFETTGARIAAQIRAGDEGFITMRREDLRSAFGIGRMSQGLAEQVFDALSEQGMIVWPHPGASSHFVRIYDRKHPVGQAALAAISPDETTDAPLRRLAQLHARARAGEELRSDDVPWLDAFDILLQLATGREPEGWEDLRDDRHGSVLAQTLAESLGLEANVVNAGWFVDMAVAVTAKRPRRRPFRSEELAVPPAAVEATEELAGVLGRWDVQLREAHREALEVSARIALGGASIPQVDVELGVLGMRRRVEERG